jgi:4-hydroxy-2-oxoheptanedioate aldolase
VAIAASGVDGLVIGPTDLSADLGEPGRFAADVYRNAFEQVERAGRAHHLILGSKVHPPFGVDRLLEGGHRFILATSDIAALAGGLRSARQAIALRTSAGR